MIAESAYDTQWGLGPGSHPVLVRFDRRQPPVYLARALADVERELSAATR